MQVLIAKKVLELVQGDITLAEVDALVNAANRRLVGGGGVDGAIHRRGGPSIMQDTERRYPNGCPTGSAVISTAGDLPADFVIHAVGPVYRDGLSGEAELLKSAYRQCFVLARENYCQSIALPALSTGAYRYPIEQASRIALEAAIESLEEHRLPNLIRFVLFTEGAYGAFVAALENLMAR